MAKYSAMQMAIVATAILIPIIGALTLTLLPFQIPGNDKIYHVIAFGALAFPLSAFRPRWALWIVVASSLYGGGIEIVQPYVGRNMELLDFGADVLGASLGAICGLISAKYIHFPNLPKKCRPLSEQGPDRDVTQRD